MITFPLWYPLPALPANWQSMSKVLSDDRKSGRCSPMSANIAPTSVTLGISSPLATTCVPTNIWVDPVSRERIDSLDDAADF